MRFLSIVALVVALFVFGCATVPKIQYQKTVEAQLLDSKDADQTKNSISVKVNPLDVKKEMQSEIYNQNIAIQYTPFLGDPGNYSTPMTINFFADSTPFEATVINNTDHILRMGDARIAYIDPASDEPVMALDAASIMSDPTILPAYKATNSYIADKYKPNSESYKMYVGQALGSIAKQTKFVNAFNREIMPGMRYSGIVMIPVSNNKITEGKLSFIDLVSKTDAAGNPVEKVRFDYRIKAVERYWKLDKATNANWVEINAEEYNIGLMPQAKN